MEQAWSALRERCAGARSIIRWHGLALRSTASPGSGVDKRHSHTRKEADAYRSVARGPAGTRSTYEDLYPRTAISESQSPEPIPNSEAKRPRAASVVW